jgi:glycosyltransferase involved in cell wall biosynthesis
MHGNHLLGVASANPTKNLERRVGASGRLAVRDDLRLVLVGGRNDAVFADGSEGACCGVSRAASRGRVPAIGPAGVGAAQAEPPGVLRTGPVDDATLKSLYLNARALAFLSLYEDFGPPPLEAMPLGRLVVAARKVSLPEVCGDAALYVDPASVDSIAAGMRRILEDDALCARLVAAGRARAAAMTWRAAARRMLAVLAGERPPVRPSGGSRRAA